MEENNHPINNHRQRKKKSRPLFLVRKLTLRSSPPQYIVLLCLVAVAAARNWYSFDLDDDDFYRPARRSWKAVGGWRAASAPSKRFYFDSDEDSDSYED